MGDNETKGGSGGIKGRGGEERREGRGGEQLAEGRGYSDAVRLSGARRTGLVTKSHPVLLGPKVTAGRVQGTEPCCGGVRELP